ncbi:MAG: hypothetical protein ACP5TW_06515 [Thermoplasmata archaeon]
MIKMKIKGLELYDGKKVNVRLRSGSKISGTLSIKEYGVEIGTHIILPQEIVEIEIMMEGD